MDINTIASMAGVSRATVSRYLNNGYVSDEKRRLIARIIKETGYVPSKQAQTLRTGKTGLVGVIIPRINSTSVSRMVTGMTQVFNTSDYQILLACTNNDEGAEVSYLRLFEQRNQVDGVILLGTVMTAAHREALGQLKVPVVVLAQDLPGYTSVFHDDYHAVREITLHALRHGERPVFIGVKESDFAAGHERRRGFLDACSERGISLPEGALPVADFSFDAGYLCCEEVMDRLPETDTIICATDSIAFGAMTCLREYGHRVPEDVQVTGVGDSDTCQVVSPTLTTIHHHYKTSGAEAAQILLAGMDSGDNVRREVRIGYELLVRNSTR